MERVSRPLLLIAVALLACLSACSPGAKDVESVAVRVDCGSACTSFAVTMFAADDSYTIERFFEPSRYDGPPLRARVKEALAALPLNDIRHCPPAGSATPWDALSVVVRFTNDTTAVCRTTAFGPFGRGSPEQMVRAYAHIAGGVYTAALASERFAMDRAVRDGTLTEVDVTRTPCFGSCPAYSVRFTANGAVISGAYQRCRFLSSAHIPFANVRRALYESNVMALQPQYVSLAVDTPGATLVLRTARETFVSRGPDAAFWGSAFNIAVARLDQIVVDTTWRPALPPRPTSIAAPPCRHVIR